MVLSREDVAAGPGDLSTEGNQSLDEDSGLNGCRRSEPSFIHGPRRRTHVEATGNAGALEGLVSAVLAADSHQARHLNLGELNLAAAEGGQGLTGQHCGWTAGGQRGRLTMSATLNF